MAKNKKWSNEDKAFVTKHYGKMNLNAICEKIDRTEDAVRQFASANNLTADFISIPWTREELLFLKKNYLKLPINDICSMLERTKGSVIAKITILRAHDGMLPAANTQQINKGIVFYSGKQAQYRALMLALEIGDSFEYPTAERQMVNNCYPYFNDRIFSTKKIDDKSRRCWRVM